LGTQNQHSVVHKIRQTKKKKKTKQGVYVHRGNEEPNETHLECSRKQGYLAVKYTLNWLTNLAYSKYAGSKNMSNSKFSQPRVYSHLIHKTFTASQFA